MIIESRDQVPKDGYQVILMDCPWSFTAWSKNLGRRTAESNYKTLDYEELRRLPILELAAESAFLFFWVVSSQLDLGIDLPKFWGFEFINIAFDWMKTTSTGKPAFGMGHYTRQNNELGLLYKIGHPKRASAAVPMSVVSPRLSHSHKPDIVQERIEWFCEGDAWYRQSHLAAKSPLSSKYLEVFARQERPGWDAIGNELGNNRDIREVLKR